MEPFVFVAVPAYDAIEPRALDGLSCAANRVHWYRKVECTSLLPHTFNLLWCACLNNRSLGFTHFAMHHADIESPPDWLDVLYDEMEFVQADVLGVVVPIKDQRGLTSCGVRQRWGSIRRFTMREIVDMPLTFSASHIGLVEGEELMMNTGLWLCRLGAWADAFPGFAILSGVHADPDGTKRAKVLSEDWHFSSWLAQQGLRVFLTRKVAVKHYGKSAYANDAAWGTLSRDPGD